MGQFNWTPELFKVNDRFADNVKRGERHTAAHEVAHLLGKFQKLYINVQVLYSSIFTLED